MSIVQWGVTAGTKALLRDGEKDGKVQSIAQIVDSTINSFFPDDPKGIKLMFVKHLLIPISKILLKDNPKGYEEAKSSL